jgi:hypothetical protein
MIRVALLLALCVLAVLPQRVCTCHGVEIGRDAGHADHEGDHDHDCPALAGNTFGDGLKATADAPDAPLAFAELLPLFDVETIHRAAEPARPAQPHPDGVPLFISLLTLRI